MSSTAPSQAKGEHAPGNVYFPFKLEDLRYFVVRRKDGTVTKYTITGKEDAQIILPGTSQNLREVTQSPSTAPHKSLSKYCAHNGDKKIFEGTEFDLYIADTIGTRAHYNEFDFVLDCGDNLTLDTHGRARSADRILTGDPELVAALDSFNSKDLPPARILKIDWDDRKAPALDPEFWPKLAEKLYGTVLCSCQGGHGRSGSALVCLMMACEPNYTPKDAIIHLRALHCPRAIESYVQHEYIDKVGKFLGREENAKEVHEIKDYHKAFLALPYSSVKKYQDAMVGGK